LARIRYFNCARGTTSGRSAGEALAFLSTLESVDLVLPTTKSREIRLRRIAEPRSELKAFSPPA
jgi:hypothetical protein